VNQSHLKNPKNPKCLKFRLRPKGLKNLKNLKNLIMLKHLLLLKYLRNLMNQLYLINH
jgi:hypothetical protein